MVTNIFAGLFFALCLYAALKDIATLTIPNWLNAWLAFLFIPAAIVLMPGWEVIGWHVLAATIAFAACVLLFMLGVFGGGDAKMIPGIILWLGPNDLMSFFYAMTLSGAALAIIVYFSRRVVPAETAPFYAYETLQKGQGVPYGVAIIIGAFAAAPSSPFLANYLS
ncbi:prepilin peptidase [Hyphomonas sp. FCG-A18]|uniref:A24 family peptidase n=1 Tax=Hyphomonas sp. FCG-A18 TaxID=3080019 RepID=UPI002B2E00B0|nr:prepilin peptidase [Hyphomonas sp. FCG-A18]